MPDAAMSFYQNLWGTTRVETIRRYPHEEMMRFIGRYFLARTHGEDFFTFNFPERKRIRILDAGCGAGSNLWAIAKEGFDAYGMDFSPEAIALCRKMISLWNTEATLKTGDFRALPFEDNFFDGIVEVYSSCALLEKDYKQYLKEVARTLKPGGKFFSWNPSAESDAFKYYSPANIIEPYTLDSIKRPTSPFFGNAYSFRFLTPEAADKAYEYAGLRIIELERTGRTYRNGEEYFEWLSISAERL